MRDHLCLLFFYHLQVSSSLSIGYGPEGARVQADQARGRGESIAGPLGSLLEPHPTPADPQHTKRPIIVKYTRPSAAQYPTNQ